jgi:cytochrome bd-type quinol oxidase subunit 2
MKLNQNSLSAKLYRWFYKTDTMPTNLCSYFWKLVTAVIFGLPVAILTVPHMVIYHKDDSRNSFGERIVISLVIWLLVAAVICMISSLGLFLHIPNKSSLLWVMMAVGFCLWSCLILVGITWAIAKTKEHLQSKNSNTAQTDNIIVEMVKAKYHKYCPKIDWK